MFHGRHYLQGPSHDSDPLRSTSINGADRNPLTWEDETPLSVSFCIRYIRDRKKGFVPLCIQR